MQIFNEEKKVMKKESYVVNSIYKYYPGKLENKKKMEKHINSANEHN